MQESRLAENAVRVGRGQSAGQCRFHLNGACSCGVIRGGPAGLRIRRSYRVAGAYAGRILKGEKPAQLPAQQSAKAELFINLKRANALKLEAPEALRARAEEIIE